MRPIILSKRLVCKKCLAKRRRVSTSSDLLGAGNKDGLSPPAALDTPEVNLAAGNPIQNTSLSSPQLLYGDGSSFEFSPGTAEAVDQIAISPPPNRSLGNSRLPYDYSPPFAAPLGTDLGIGPNHMATSPIQPEFPGNHQFTFSDTTPFDFSPDTSFATEFNHIATNLNQNRPFRSRQLTYDNTPSFNFMSDATASNRIVPNTSPTFNRSYSNPLPRPSSIQITNIQLQGGGAYNTRTVLDTNINGFNTYGSEEWFENDQGDGANYRNRQRR